MAYKAGESNSRCEENIADPQGPLYPCNPATARSESTKLAVDPKGEKLVYTNGRAVIVCLNSSVVQSTELTRCTDTGLERMYCIRPLLLLRHS